MVGVQVFRASVSTAALMWTLVATPSIAQVATSVSAQDSATPTTQTVPGDQAASANEDIVVTGYRASLQSAQEIKRKASSVVEAITSEDLGKFTDNSIADAIQRVPGLQIQRNDGGQRGERVAIRGLGQNFVTTTVNGRVLASYGSEGISELRSFNLDVFPTEVLSGTLIYKSPTADLPESGIAGEVELQTLRPLDYKAPGGRKYFASLTGRLQDDDQTSQLGRGFSGIVGGKFFNDTLGVYVAGTYSDVNSRVDEFSLSRDLTDVSVRSAAGVVNVVRDVYFPRDPNAQSIKQQNQRRAFNVGFQWKPTPTLEFTGDYLYSVFDRPSDRRNPSITIGSQTIRNGIFEADGIEISNGAVNYLNFARYTPPAGTAANASLINLGSFDYTYDNLSTTTSAGFNAKWENDGWKVALDYSNSSLDFVQDLTSLFCCGTDVATTGISFDTRGGGAAVVTTGPNQLTAATYPTNFLFRRAFVNRTDINAYRADFSKIVSDAITLEAGVRISDATVDVRSTNLFSALTPAQQATVRTTLFPGGNDTLFPRTNIGFNTGPNTVVRNAINANAAIIPEFDTNVAPLGGTFGDITAQGGYNADPSTFFRVREKIQAYYAQAKLDTSLGDNPLSGNIGLRAVHTDERAQAFQAVQLINPLTGVAIVGSATSTLVADQNDYWTFLPSLNVLYKPSDAVNLRFGVARTMTRPEYEQLAPRNVLTVPDPADPRSVGVVGTGSAGNTQLKPQTSWNYDLTAEYYGSDGSAFVVSAFYKDVKDFIFFDTTRGASLATFPGTRFDLTQAVNLSSGRAYGFEVGANKPLTFLPSALAGLGIQANYTYVDSKVSAQLNGAAATFPGSSKHNVNGTLYYARKWFDGRVSYVYRSDFLASLSNGLGLNSLPTYTNGYGQFDASATIKFNRHVDLTISGTNLLKEDRRDYNYSSSFFRGYFSRSRKVAVALRVAL